MRAEFFFMPLDRTTEQKERELNRQIKEYEKAGEEVASLCHLGLPGDPVYLFLLKTKREAPAKGIPEPPMAYVSINEAFEELHFVIGTGEGWAMVRAQDELKPFIVREQDIQRAPANSPKRRRK